MKRTILAAAGLTALLATPAFAASSSPYSASIGISGDVAAQCEFRGAPTGAQTIPISGFTTDGYLNANAEQVVDAALAGITADDIWCNGAGTDITYRATPFHSSQASNNGDFVDRINYVATINAAPGHSITLDTAYAPARNQAAETIRENYGAFQGDFGMTVDFTNPNKRLIAGTWSASVSVTVTPGL